jgi:hypothetical protein
VPTFVAEVEFTFESEGDAVGAALRRLQQAARDAGFDLVRGKAAPAPPEDDGSGWTSYGPALDEDA